MGEFMEKAVYKISVRNLVEFMLRAGDINMSHFISSQALAEGTRIHRKLQKEAGEGYSAEIRLAASREFKDFILEVSGIADGMFTIEEGVFIDEIKTVSIPLDLVDEDYNPLHWAQAKCYAFMYASEYSLDRINVRLTYYNTDTDERKYLMESYGLSELEEFFTELTDKFSIWAEFAVNHKRARDNSITGLPFPYESYRKGQRELAVSTYYAIRNKNKLFARAPTGIGKTISVLYPTVMAMGNGMGEKIFYLTARTITRQAAEDALKKMIGKGLVVKHITITSKDRICPNSTHSCNPIDCPWAKGHFDRVNAAILDILLNESMITRDILESYSRKHNVCPFEYTLDISSWVDLIVCDYNYAFDPRAYLRRFFDAGGDYTLLTDEAHNLVDRAREMFSASLDKSSFMNHRQTIKDSAPGLYKAFTKINKYFIGLRKGFEKKYETRKIDLPMDFYELLTNFIEEFETHMFKNRDSKVDNSLLELFFDCLSFAAVYRFYDERFTAFVTREDNNVEIRLFCIDPSHLLAATYKKCRTSIFFSATLSPIKYYMDMLGGSESDRVVNLPSPFERSNMCLLVVGNLSTRYRDREETIGTIVDYIGRTTDIKLGNYLVFFPSFEYMNAAVELYRERRPHDRIIIQGRGMAENEREDFLLSFKENPEHTLIGFAVLGGIFSEGIDLAGERLAGVIIVGVGLPQLCAERDTIRDYFNSVNNMGFEYSYRFPGMNRVLQAAGRVIRTEMDKGFVMLIDDRFLQWSYVRLFPEEWQDYNKIYSPESAERILENFWYSPTN
jgi:DNA excision repair protein ERCC-2